VVDPSKFRTLPLGPRRKAGDKTLSSRFPASIRLTQVFVVLEQRNKHINPMDFRLPARRVLYTLGTACIFTFLLFRFHATSNSPAFEKQRWASASGHMGDIRNSTLGVSLTFLSLSGCLFCRHHPPRRSARDDHLSTNLLCSSKRYLLSACPPGQTVAMA
jgi:hypothetical protein